MKLQSSLINIPARIALLCGVLYAGLSGTTFGLPLKNGWFSSGINHWQPGWEADGFFSVRQNGQESFLRYLRTPDRTGPPNAVIKQPVQLQQDRWYTLTVDYQTDASLMPLIVLTNPQNPKEYRPVRLFRLPPAPTRSRFESRLNIGRHPETLTLEIYPGVNPAEPLRNHAYPASFHPGQVDIHSISIEPSSFVEPEPEPADIPFNTETVVYKNADGMDLIMKIDTPIEPPDGKMPVMFWVHGGGWVTGSPDGMKWRAAPLAPRGVANIRVQYRLIKDGGTFPKSFQDLLDAVQWLRDHAEEYHLDLSRLAIGGGSAGAQLSSILAQKTPECIAYIGMCGLYDLVDLGTSRFGRSDRFLLDNDPQILREASAYHNIRTNPPAALLIHGTADPTIDYTQSVRFAERIKNAGGQAETLILEGTGHDFGYLHDVNQAINRFLSRAGFFTRERPE